MNAPSLPPHLMICVGCNVAGPAGMPILVLEPEHRDHWPRMAATFLEQHMQWAQVRLLVACAMPEDDAAQAAVLAACKHAADSAAIGQHTASHFGATWGRHFVLNVANRAPMLSLAMGALEGQAVFVCGAGPSLEHALPHVTELRKRGLIFATSNAAPALLKAGCTPDAVFCCEAQDVSDGLWAVAESDTHYETLHVIDMLANPANWAVPADRHYAIASHEPNLARYIRMLGGIPIAYTGSVSCAATSAAVALGARAVVLLGQDLGYPHDRMYAKGSLYDDLAVTRDPSGALTFAGDSKRKAPVPRLPTRVHRYWTVPHEEGQPPTMDTDASFDGFRAWFAKAAQRRTIISASEGGSHIPGTIALGLAEVLRSLEPLSVRASMPTVQRLDDAALRERATALLDDIEARAREHIDRAAIMPDAAFPLLNLWMVGKILAAQSATCSPRERVDMYREAVRWGCNEALSAVAQAREEMA